MEYCEYEICSVSLLLGVEALISSLPTGKHKAQYSMEWGVTIYIFPWQNINFNWNCTSPVKHINIPANLHSEGC